MRAGLVTLAVVALLVGAGCTDVASTAGDPPGEAVVRVLAARGDAEAQVTLGWMYETGRGVVEDPAAAAHWYGKAAAQGNALAQYALAELYARGAGVEQDYGAAVRWYRVAAEAGNASAQYKLGSLYERGLGVPRDYRTAARWYERAGERWRSQSTLPPGAERVSGPPVVALVLTPPAPERAPTARAAPPGERAANDEAADDLAQIAPAAGGGNDEERWLHLASFRTRRAAARQWDEMRRAHGDILGDYRARLVRVDLGVTLGVWIRVNLGPFADAAAAKALCRRLKERDVYCRLLPR